MHYCETYSHNCKKNKNMFSLFKKKNQKEKLNTQYKKLLKEAHSLSTSNRQLSDKKVSEANEVLKQLEALIEA